MINIPCEFQTYLFLFRNIYNNLCDDANRDDVMFWVSIADNKIIEAHTVDDRIKINTEYQL